MCEKTKINCIYINERDTIHWINIVLWIVLATPIYRLNYYIVFYKSNKPTKDK